MMIENPIYQAFPERLQYCVSKIQHGTNLNSEFLLSSILYASSVAIGNTHKIQLLESWEEACNLYMVIVGKSGMSKSPAINIALKPLNERNRQMAKVYQDKKLYFDLKSKEEKASETPPSREQIIIEDATLESIYRTLSDNKRGIGMCYDEIIGFLNNLSRYSNGSDQQQWLKLWGGAPLNVNRVNSGSYYVHSPFIGFIGGIQPKVLPQLNKDDRDKNGFLERILFVYPDNVKKEPFPLHQTPQSIFDDYSDIINRLLSLEMKDDRNTISNLLYFTKEAADYYQGYYNMITDLINNSDDEDPISGFYPKMNAYCGRFALILQLLYWACGEENKQEVGIRAIKGASKISEYYLKNATKALCKPRNVSLNKDQKKNLAKRMQVLQNYGTREIGNILEVSHTTISKWIKE